MRIIVIDDIISFVWRYKKGRRIYFVIFFNFEIGKKRFSDFKERFL